MPKPSHGANLEKKASNAPKNQHHEARPSPTQTTSSPSSNDIPPGPKIVIDAHDTASNLPDFGGRPTSLTQEHIQSDDEDNQTSSSAENSDSGDEQSTSSAGGSEHDNLVPTTFRYTSSVKCMSHPLERMEIRRKENQQLRWNEKGSYREVEEIARQIAKEISGDSDEGKIMALRHGYCTISHGNGDSQRRLGLKCQSDCQNLCEFLVREYGFASDKGYHLVIHQEYFELRIRPNEGAETTLDEIKEWELEQLIQTNIDDEKFISNADLRMYTSDQMVRVIVTCQPCWDSTQDPDIEGLVQNIILKNARKLLAMCVYKQVSMKCLRALLDVERCHDHNLPVTLKNCCKRHRNYPKELYEYHAMFQAAQFDTIGKYQHLSSSVVVPVIAVDAQGEQIIVKEEGSSSSRVQSRSAKDRAMIGSGSHGSVYRVRLDPYHHELSEDRDAMFALKEFKVTVSGSDSGKNFDREVKILELLRQYSDRHLTTHLVMWAHGDRYYSLFPLATCNLYQYMKKNPFEHNKVSQIWLLKQFSGLAAALQRIHDLTFTRSATNVNPHLIPQNTERIAGWHHDLKPENILCFAKTHSEDETFQIADFGSSKIRIISSRSPTTGSQRGTLTYEPPELEIEGQMSRPYDIWSLGCVFLEILVWALLGFSDLKKFKDSRIDKRTLEGFDDDGFWAKGPNDDVTLRESVLLWIRKLEEEVQDQLQRPFKGILDVVTTQMLVIDRRNRIFADALSLDMERILAETEIVLKRGIDVMGPDNKSSEIPLVALLPQSNPANPSRRPSMALSPSDAGSTRRRNLLMTDLDRRTTFSAEHMSPQSTYSTTRHSSMTNDSSHSEAKHSRAPSNTSSLSLSPLNPHAARNETSSPTNLRAPTSPKPPTGSRPPSGHSGPSTTNEGGS